MPDPKRPPAAMPKSAKPPPPSKRRVVNLADDADEVLAQCRKLRDALRKKQTRQAAAADDDEDTSDDWGLDDDSYSDKGKGKKKKQKKKASGAAIKTDIDAEGDPKKAKTQQLSLSELKSMTKNAGGRKSIVEVVEMNSTEVMEGIENVAVTIAHQVLARQGFQLDIPCEFLLTFRLREHQRFHHTTT